MDSIKEELNFDLLGHKVRISKDDIEGQIPASEVVEYVCLAAQKIKEKSSHLEHGQIAVLVALQMASEKLSLDYEYRENIEKLQTTASDALRYIEEVSPTTAN